MSTQLHFIDGFGDADGRCIFLLLTVTALQNIPGEFFGE
jgi:hypothetical protein